MGERMSKWYPEVMHHNFGTDGTVCGAKNHTWPEQYMDEFVARKIPRCNDCMRFVALIIVNQLKANKTPVKREETQVMQVYLKDYLTI